ncbi:MAG TPA: hypothetical protein PLZ77_05295 [Lachnospiraceae bacterium]|nr:hypothetical protein [Lachnospiraceae bacterium]HPF29507.1 hypothetical protein [Lachnospiraceae bacterium]
MKEIKVNISATNVRSLKFENKFSGKSGEAIKIQVKSAVSVKLNPETPTAALVLVKFTAEEENKVFNLEMETFTPVNVSSFVDNLDEVIKKQYIASIMLGVNEKIRTTAAILGLNIQVPAMVFNHSGQSDSIDAEIFGAR